jgi:hypothetical protein
VWGAIIVSSLTIAGPAYAETGSPASHQSGTGSTVSGGFQYNTRGPGGDSSPSGDTSAAPVVQSWDCGPPVPMGHVLQSSDFCGQAHDACAGDAATNTADQPVTTIASRTQNPDRSWSSLTIDCAASAITNPVPAAAVQASFVKLLPHLPINTAPNTGQSLVNAETLFWIPTTTTLNLGTTTLLGHHITLYATIASVQWNFGDGTTTTTPNPGRPFRTTDHCTTAQCPAWFGHTYTTTSHNTPMTVTATINWTGRYTIDRGTLLQIPATVTTTPTPIPMTVVQAQSVLVPNTSN